MALISMKRLPEESEAMENPNEYGYGLCLYLEEDQTQALGIETLPEPGQYVTFEARARVTRTMVENDGEGPEKHLELQITELSPLSVERQRSAREVYPNSGMAE